MCQSAIPAMERLSFLRSQTYRDLLDFAEHEHVNHRVTDLARCRMRLETIQIGTT
jgi:hypothetical protein